MKNYLKNIAMAAVIGFAVGAALALALPTLAGWAGVEVAAAVGEMANPMWLGAFAGGWGAIGAALTPPITYAFNALFSDKPKASHDVTISIPAHTMSNGKSAGLDLTASSSTYYQDKVAAERAAQIGNPGRGA